MERVFTTGTATTIVCQLVKISAVASWTKPVSIFKAFLRQISSRFILVAN